MAFDGLQAISESGSSRITARGVDWEVDEQGIDAFELEASRRILANLRTLLYGQPMWDLIAAQVDESERRFQEWYAQSDGRYTGGRLRLQIPGLTVEELFGTIAVVLGAARAEGEERRDAVVGGVFPAHPEHYGLAPGAQAGGVETMGGLPTLTFPAYVDATEVPEFIRELIDESFDVSRVGRGLLRDDTVQSYVLQQFRDTPDGIEASLDIWYPAACPPHVVEEHLRHYAVEFRNGVRMATAARRQAAAADGLDSSAQTAGPSAPAPSSGVVGRWQLTGTGGGSERSFTLDLDVAGDGASGRIEAADGRSADATHVTIDGSTVRFTASLGLKVAFALEVHGDEITGTMKPGILPKTTLTGARVR